MILIDTHCHIYLDEFNNDLKNIIQNAENEDIVKMLMPAIDSSTHFNMLNVEKEFKNTCYSMMGLHPCSVKVNFEEELKIALDFLKKEKFVAVGEIGLDYHWDLSFKSQQIQAFETQIKWAIDFSLPIVIHSRNSIDECIEIVSKHQNGKLRGVFHCFSGNLEQAIKITDLGFYMGIGGVVTYKNAGLDNVIRETGIKKVVLETDSPYLSPVPFRGKRNQPAYLKHIVEKLSSITNADINEVAKITSKNAKDLFGL